ncbi:hypothetical protein IOD16_02285 [Saccharothrix sp. 6-C]|uniref:hypothetical protein n=1 Tax=Saccharothrix sp. 6-C TaxID=2781735 RepID=UPI00191703E4|nr:hypothetical protein [Saccharothrix sp. 6-C]QQQ77393.1 hypothetical protein IOD16_02285 [Saccharothrix sp. 6-C]
MTTPQRRRSPAGAGLPRGARLPGQLALGGLAVTTLSTGLSWSLTTALLVLAVGGAGVFAFAICARRDEPWQRLAELVRLLRPEPRVPRPTAKSAQQARNSR